jgi:hypothetical protein
MFNKIKTLIFILFLAIGSSQCHKEVAKGVIKVVDINNNAIPDADVKVYSKPANSTVEMNYKTNATGEVSFEVEQEYVLSISAQKIIDDSLYVGDGVMQLLYGTTATKKIILKKAVDQ